MLIPLALEREIKAHARRNLVLAPTAAANILAEQLGSVANAKEWLREKGYAGEWPWWRDVGTALDAMI